MKYLVIVLLLLSCHDCARGQFAFDIFNSRPVIDFTLPPNIYTTPRTIPFAAAEFQYLPPCPVGESGVDCIVLPTQEREQVRPFNYDQAPCGPNGGFGPNCALIATAEEVNNYFGIPSLSNDYIPPCSNGGSGPGCTQAPVWSSTERFYVPPAPTIREYIPPIESTTERLFYVPPADVQRDYIPPCTNGGSGPDCRTTAAPDVTYLPPIVPSTTRAPRILNDYIPPCRNGGSGPGCTQAPIPQTTEKPLYIPPPPPPLPPAFQKEYIPPCANGGTGPECRTTAAPDVTYLPPTISTTAAPPVVTREYIPPVAVTTEKYLPPVIATTTTTQRPFQPLIKEYIPPCFNGGSGTNCIRPTQPTRIISTINIQYVPPPTVPTSRVSVSQDYIPPAPPQISNEYLTPFDTNTRIDHEHIEASSSIDATTPQSRQSLVCTDEDATLCLIKRRRKKKIGSSGCEEGKSGRNCISNQNNKAIASSKVDVEEENIKTISDNSISLSNINSEKNEDGLLSYNDISSTSPPTEIIPEVIEESTTTQSTTEYIPSTTTTRITTPSTTTTTTPATTTTRPTTTTTRRTTTTTRPTTTTTRRTTTTTRPTTTSTTTVPTTTTTTTTTTRRPETTTTTPRATTAQDFEREVVITPRPKFNRNRTPAGTRSGSTSSPSPPPVTTTTTTTTTESIQIAKKIESSFDRTNEVFLQKPSLEILPPFAPSLPPLEPTVPPPPPPVVTYTDWRLIVPHSTSRK